MVSRVITKIKKYNIRINRILDYLRRMPWWAPTWGFWVCWSTQQTADGTLSIRLIGFWSLVGWEAPISSWSPQQLFWDRFWNHLGEFSNLTAFKFFPTTPSISQPTVQAQGMSWPGTPRYPELCCGHLPFFGGKICTAGNFWTWWTSPFPSRGATVWHEAYLPSSCSWAQ